MADDESTQPSESGVQQDSEETRIVPSSPTVDMLALGFGMLEIAPLEDNTKQNEVSVFCVLGSGPILEFT